MSKAKWVSNYAKYIVNELRDRKNRVGRKLDIDDKLAVLCRTLLETVYDAANPLLTLKVKRSDDAKVFPLINIKKAGDVGLDLPTVLPYKEHFSKPIDRCAYMDGFTFDNDKTDIEIDRDMRQEWSIAPGESIKIPTGIHIELPEGYWASIEARSSTSQQKLIVPKGVIDEGYRGELFATLINVGNETIPIRHGDRFVQLIIHKRHSSNLIVADVDELSPSERGSSGFGSTGQSEVGQKSWTHTRMYYNSLDDEGNEIAHGTYNIEEE